jgi:hypothetical protein
MVHTGQHGEDVGRAGCRGPRSFAPRPGSKLRRGDPAHHRPGAGRRYEQAIPINRELIAEFPADPSFGINLADAQYQIGRYRETIELCSTLVKRHPSVSALWLFLGGSYLSLDDAAKAVDPLKEGGRPAAVACSWESNKTPPTANRARQERRTLFTACCHDRGRSSPGDIRRPIEWSSRPIATLKRPADHLNTAGPLAPALAPFRHPS